MFPLRFCFSVPFSFPAQAQHVSWSCMFSWSIELIELCLFSQCFCKTRCSIFPFIGSLRAPLLLRRYTLPFHSFPLCFQTNMLANKTGFCFYIQEHFLFHVLAGYQKQLSYKHPDGSYSIFGTRDKEGNTWWVTGSRIGSEMNSIIVMQVRGSFTGWIRCTQLSKTGSWEALKEMSLHPLPDQVHEKKLTPKTQLTFWLMVLLSPMTPIALWCSVGRISQNVLDTLPMPHLATTALTILPLRSTQRESKPPTH